MISLATLCEQIQSKLNGNTEGKKFELFSDTGDYLKAVRAGNTVTEYINGLAQVVQSSITPTQGLVVATQQVRLEFAFPVEEYNIPLGTDETVTGALAGYISSPNAAFQPLNANYGILRPLGEGVRDKAKTPRLFAERALACAEALAAAAGARG